MLETAAANDLLANDLRVYRGGNKARLVARIYMALKAEGKTTLYGYENFRAAYTKQSFQKLHTEFDHVLPMQFRG